MLYRKNLYTWEQALRVVLSLALGAFGVFSGLSLILKGVIIFSAVFGIVTGFIGFCPACALVGKKLKE
jgi:Protein of unknown function (DUF2892)